MKQDIKLTYLKKATKFLLKHPSVITEEQVDTLIIKFIKRKIYNLDENVDYKQMSGAISNVYRIRKGNIRIIVTLKNHEIIIEAIIADIGFRGGIYK
ncbi:hypothetical protein MNB_SM-3-1200 [hydrothermal vent metagenome]|uniref:RelE/StbE replicon stabilization toxin n=1 Tax=hydrothermal vent metagenome TaxID=652676 RepID=A0A1W1D391_9ZZZZ